MKKTPDAHFFDDIARVAGGAVNIMSGLQQQIHNDIKSRFDDLAGRLNLVPREDLERAEARIAKLEKAVAELQDKNAHKKPGAVKSAGKKKKT